MTGLTFIEGILMIKGIGADYVSAWFAISKCQEGNDPIQIQKMIKYMVQVEDDYSHLTKQDLRTARISELSRETGLTVKLLGRAIGSFGKHYRLGDLARSYNYIFGIPLDISDEITNTIVLYVDSLPRKLFENAGDEVEVTIRTSDGREVTFTMKASDALFFK